MNNKKDITLELASCKPNHVLHFLLTLFTAGIWAIVWIIITGNAKGKRDAIRVANGYEPEEQNKKLGRFVQIVIILMFIASYVGTKA